MSQSSWVRWFMSPISALERVQAAESQTLNGISLNKYRRKQTSAFEQLFTSSVGDFLFIFNKTNKQKKTKEKENTESLEVTLPGTIGPCSVPGLDTQKLTAAHTACPARLTFTTPVNVAGLSQSIFCPQPRLQVASTPLLQLLVRCSRHESAVLFLKQGLTLQYITLLSWNLLCSLGQSPTKENPLTLPSGWLFSFPNKFPRLSQNKMETE